MMDKGVIDFVINGSMITFISDRGELPELASITNQTQVYVKAYKNIPSITSMDYLPAYDTYTQVQDNTFIIDEQQDYIGSQADAYATPVDIYDFRLVTAE